FLLLGNAYPINVMKSLKSVDEVLSIFAATSNPLTVIVLEEGQRRGIIGVLDGQIPLGVEEEEDIKERRDFLRKIGYKI
ncbi:adenosine monophosphate-protein transferase, partial [candidate division WOR-3 bacterium]|nr:adenosine monophosphate-protein transferase [candidate division WOR-3 bacterium]